MKNIEEKILNIEWGKVTEQMNEKGFAIVPALLAKEDCRLLINNYDNQMYYRKTIVMEHYRFGSGEYKYFTYPLPDLLQSIRKEVYTKLTPITNNWMDQLNTQKKFPDTFEEFQKLCNDNNQSKPTVLILKYGKGGHNTLHQDLYGDVFFPIQAVLFLNEPDKEYTGGEFVLTQQMPRAQSKAIVLKPRQGDMLLVTTNFRPVKGSRGYYKVSMKHGVSELHSGERHTIGIIFHDALT